MCKRQFPVNRRHAGRLHGDSRDAGYTESRCAKVRSEVIKTVKIGIVTKIYTDLRGVLTQCKLDGVDLIKLTGGPYCANYPPIETDSRILSLAKTLDKELDEIVNIIVPPFSDILHNRLESKAV